MSSAPRIVVIGQTASGKSALAIAIAQQLCGVVLGADSRQVYRFMDIGSGKEQGLLQKYPHPRHSRRNAALLNTAYIIDNVPHYMIDVVHPRTPYGVAQYCRRAQRILTACDQEKILPIICGGSHFWVQALLEKYSFPPIAPQSIFRTQSAQKTTAALFALLQKDAPTIAKCLQEKNEQNNRHRIIRSLERAAAGIAETPWHTHPPDPHTTLILAYRHDRAILAKRIADRLDARLAQGMLEEIHTLHTKHRVPWNRLTQFGLEYAWGTAHIRGQISITHMRERIIRESIHFAKRQETWIRRWERSGAHIIYISSLSEGLSHAHRFSTHHEIHPS